MPDSPLLTGTINAAKNMELITPEQLLEITDTISMERCIVMAPLLNELCSKYGITDKLPFQMFLANLLQESGELSYKEENMFYRAARIRAVWPDRFATTKDAEPFARNPEALANKVYGGRMGNNQPGDGWAFRGGGFIGITGRELYTKYAEFSLLPNATEAADAIRTKDRYALDSACWFFSIHRKLIPVTLTGNFKKVVKGINGGYIGLDVREKYYKRIQQVLN